MCVLKHNDNSGRKTKFQQVASRTGSVQSQTNVLASISYSKSRVRFILNVLHLQVLIKVLEWIEAIWIAVKFRISQVDKIQRDPTLCRYLFNAKLLYTFLASIAPITRNTQNCSSSLLYRSYYLTSLNRLSHTSPYLVTFEEACFPDSMICTRGCNYSFMYS